ncbi:hypothetical protein PAEPH01_1662 [Pancytospora epiphaga]|nr:hypothetical protein PAEPH01_1662 [Pancytospora epiphaga]
MEEILQIEAPHNTVRCGPNIIVMFTPNESVFSIYTIHSQAILQHDTGHPIVNIECSGRFIFVFHDEFYNEYDSKTYKLVNTVNKSGIRLKYMIGRSKSILVCRDGKMLIVKDKETAPVVHKIVKAGIIRGKYFFYLKSDGRLNILKSKKNVYSELMFNPSVQWLDIKDAKLYCLQNSRISGHDLNIYLDEIEGMTPGKFTNLENELILYDYEKKELHFYQKNMEVVLFSAFADDYVYNSSDCQLFILHKGMLRIYRRFNECQRDFKFITKSVDYVEHEDEFDESDSSYADLNLNAVATIHTQV